MQKYIMQNYIILPNITIFLHDKAHYLIIFHNLTFRYCLQEKIKLFLNIQNTDIYATFLKWAESAA